MNKIRLILVFLMLAMVSLFPFTAKSQEVAVVSEAATVALDKILPVDPAITVGTFSNGLTYYIRENKKPENRAELRLVVNVGSIVEDDDEQGLAHFLEHMAFNGSKNFEKQELVNYMESIGMRFGSGLNAYTSFDETVYMLRIPTDTVEVMEKGFLILKDWAHQLSLNPEEIDKERGVIVEEWRLGQGAGARMRDKQFPIILKGSQYANRIPIGKKEIIESFEYIKLGNFYRRWYRFDLMAVVAIGDFDKDHIEKLIKLLFDLGTDIPQFIPFETSPEDIAPRERKAYEVPDHKETLFAIATDKEATGTSVTIYYKHPLRDQSAVGAYRRSIVERLYNSMLNSRLSELTQKEDPPFLFGSAGNGLFTRTKEVYTLSAAVKDNGMDQGLEALLVEAERVARFGFTPTELERRKLSVLRGIERSYTERANRTSASYASEYIRNFLEDEPIPGIEYEYELYKRFVPEITLDEINKLSQEWITKENRVITVNAPEKEGLHTPTEQELLAVFDRVNSLTITAYEDKVTDEPLITETPDPAYITNETKIPEVNVTEWRLSNGVKVVLKPTDFKEDQILFRAFSPGGSSLASDEDYIPAGIAASIISAGGLGAFNNIELGKKLAGKAVSVYPSIGSLQEGLSGSASPKDIETMFQLIYLTFTAPRADETVFNSLQSRNRAFLENIAASPASVFLDTLSCTMTQYHYRTRPASLEQIDEWDLDKSLEFYKDRFADAGDFTFLFVGNIVIDEIRPLVQTYLGGLPSTGRVETWRDVGIDPPKGVIKKTVRKGIEPKSQTVIIFTGPFEYNRASRNEMNVMTSILNIRLREKIREELGGTYGVSVSQSTSWIPDEEYSIRISFGADPERIEELTKAVFDEINAMKEQGVTQKNFDKVLETIRRSRETNLKENGYWLNQLGFRYRQDGDPKDILTYEKSLEDLNLEVIRLAANKYFNMNNYVQVTLMPEVK